MACMYMEYIEYSQIGVSAVCQLSTEVCAVLKVHKIFKSVHKALPGSPSP